MLGVVAAATLDPARSPRWPPASLPAAGALPAGGLAGGGPPTAPGSRAAAAPRRLAQTGPVSFSPGPSPGASGLGEASRNARCSACSPSRSGAAWTPRSGRAAVTRPGERGDELAGLVEVLRRRALLGQAALHGGGAHQVDRGGGDDLGGGHLGDVAGCEARAGVGAHPATLAGRPGSGCPVLGQARGSCKRRFPPPTRGAARHPGPVGARASCSGGRRGPRALVAAAELVGPALRAGPFFVRARAAAPYALRGGHISAEPRINDRIRVPEVRLVGPNGEQVGIVAIGEAIKLAQDSDLDLVEVAPMARPPVCKLMDYGKFKYETAQKARESRKNQVLTVIKEMKLRPKIDPHDYETKKGHVVRFLKAGDKVKITIMFRGREQSPARAGLPAAAAPGEDVQELGFVESAPKQDGRNMIMVLAPHKNAADLKKAAKDAPEAPRPEPAERDRRRAPRQRRPDPPHRRRAPPDAAPETEGRRQPCPSRRRTAARRSASR